MGILVINTQFMENYGAHDWDGEGACPQRWKYKGGSSYKVKVPFDKDYEWAEIYAERVIQAVGGHCEHENEYASEHIIGWSLEDDDWLSWFEKSQLEYEGKITYPEPVLEYNEAM
jgi:hypothetical protein